MHVQEYNFYRIVGTSDKFVKDLLPLIEELKDGDRIAYFVFCNYNPSKNVGIVVGIHDHGVGVDTELTYVGYVLARHGIVPETVKSIDPDVDTNLKNPFCFAEKAIF